VRGPAPGIVDREHSDAGARIDLIHEPPAGLEIQRLTILVAAPVSTTTSGGISALISAPAALRRNPPGNRSWCRPGRTSRALDAPTRPHQSLFVAVRPSELRDYCLSFPGAQETFPFGPENSVFKVAGKMFAVSRLAGRPLRISVKCEPALAEQLRNLHAAVLPGYHLNKRHWNTVTIDGSLPEAMIRDLIEDSYDLVVSKLPRARRQALDWDGEASAARGDCGRRQRAGNAKAWRVPSPPPT
jgi:predicted DNA-binding protein (MmcQ/YjbR family)